MPRIEEETFKELVLQSATEIVADMRQRWTIPVELALRANLGGDHSEVVITAQHFWLELWASHHWETRWAKHLACLPT